MAEKVKDRVGEAVPGSGTAAVGVPLALAGAIFQLQSFSEGYDQVVAQETDIPALLTVGNAWQTGKGSYDASLQTFTFTEIHDSSVNGGDPITLTDAAELRVAAVASVYNDVVAGGPTNLGNIPAADNVQITSSTGNPTTIAGASGTDAGVMTTAQVNSLAGKAEAIHTHVESDITDLDKYTQAEVDASIAVVQGDLDSHKDANNFHLTTDQNNAVDGANAPSGTNVFATMQDVGDVGGGTNLSNTPTTTQVTIESSSGSDTVIVAADAVQAGVMTTAQVNSLAAKIGAVIEDPTPKLGGDLAAQGNEILFQDSGNINDIGAIGVISDDSGIYAAKILNDSFDPNDAAIAVKAGLIELYGSVVDVRALAGNGAQQVYVSNGGTLYGVDPPAPGWSYTDTDIGIYPLTGLSVWVRMTGLEGVVQQDVAAGDRIDLAVNVNVVNLSSRDGTIDLGFEIGTSTSPATGQNYQVPAGFDGYITVNFSTTTHGGLATNDIISVWARRASQSNPQFDPILDGSTGDDHELILSVPGGGAGGGSPTDLGTIVGADSVTITSSTGANTVIPGATGSDAGVMTSTQVNSLAGKADALDTTFLSHVKFASQGATPGSGTTDINFDSSNQHALTGTGSIDIGAWTFPGIGGYTLLIPATLTVTSISPTGKQEYGESAYAFPAGKAHAIAIRWDGTTAHWFGSPSV